MAWGDYIEEKASKRLKKKSIVFKPDTYKGLGIPYVVPTRGNKTAAQGRYGIPAYIIYPGSLVEIKKSPQSFLKGRLERTFLPRNFTEDEVSELSNILSQFASEILEKTESGVNQGYGILVLCIPDNAEGAYRYSEHKVVAGDTRFILIGESKINPGSYIVADLERVLDKFKISKIEEGADMGKGDCCSFCGRDGEEIVSIYNKSWSLLAPTWHAPFPECHKKNNEIKDIASTIGALCPECYIDLVVGAGIFSEVSSTLPDWLRREIFLPVASAGGREEARRKVNVPNIRGSFIILPLSPERSNVDVKEEMRVALNNYRNKKTRVDKRDRTLDAIVGFESILPEELDSDQCRLYLIYYMESNADIQLRAMIEDVLPSTLNKLKTIIGNVLEKNVPTRKMLELSTSEWTAERYGSLPYLLIRAYGGCYFWQILNEILHRGTLDWDRFLAGVVARMNGYAKKMILGEGVVKRNAIHQMKEEVYFYSLFRDFFDIYQKEILEKEGNYLCDWKKQLNKLASSDPTEFSFNSPEELGFAAGHIVARFGRQYYAVAKKNFLKHRVMTFGSNLTPEIIWQRALSRFQEYALKLNIGLNPDFRKGAAIVECDYRRLREDIQKHKNEFMGAFWSGYMLSLSAEVSDANDIKNGNKEE